MRRQAMSLLLALLALPALPAAGGAQDTIPRDDTRRLPAAVAERILDFYNAPGTIHLTGPARIAPQSALRGNVAVLEGVLVVGGRVEGDVVVINGDLELLEGAAVTGSVTVVGGRVDGAARARVEGDVVAYAGRLDYVRRGERLYAELEAAPRDAGAPDTARAGDWRAVERDDRAARRDDPARAGEEEGGWSVRGGVRGRGGREGRADFVVTTGNGYNRVEGLPVTFGPVFETPGSNPFRVRLDATFRTEAGPELGPSRWGFQARVEQFFGGYRELRLGGTLFHTIDAIEEWHLTRLENGLSTFFLHRDFRDHYQREGGSVYARFDPRSAPLSVTLALRTERDESIEAGSPWTLFDNDEPWRLQPLVAEGKLNTMALTTRLDTRNDAADPSTGWLVEAEVEQGLEGTVGGLEAPYAADGLVPSQFRQPLYGLFTRGIVDVRRYNRISATARLNLRFLGGGSLDGSPLPPQRQHALGGEGSLPGFPLFALDCGARERTVRVSASGSESDFYPAYGCDNFVLGQVEYRGDLSFRVDLGGWGRDEDEDEWATDAEVSESDFHADIGWVLFADVGRGWTRTPGFLHDERTRADVGFGLLLGRLGVYLAVPVSEDRSGVNFFVRLNPRF